MAKKQQGASNGVSESVGGTSSDDMPSEDLTMTVDGPILPVPDGDYVDRGQPAQEDLFVSRGGASFNAIKEFVSGSTKPEEYLVRTNVDEGEVQMLCNIWTHNQQMTLGYIDLPQELWLMLNLRRSIKESALKMGQAMFIGERARNFAMRSGMMNRASTMNREQFTPEPK